MPDHDPHLYLCRDIRGEGVCLHVVEFVPNIAHEETWEEEIWHGQHGTNIFVCKIKKKLTPQEVSPAQWISANTQIQFKLMTSRTLSNDVTDYLAYIAKKTRMPLTNDSLQWHLMLCTDSCSWQLA